MEYLFDYGDFYFSHKVALKGKMEDDFGDHFHPTYELLLIIKGDLDYAIENRVYTLTPRSLLIIKPGEHHHVKKISPVPYERFVFRFPVSFIPEILTSPLENKKNLYSIEDRKLLAKFFHFDDFANDFNGERLKQAFISGLIVLLIYLSELKTNESDSIILDNKVNQILNYINDNLNRNITINDLCKNFYISKSNLYKIFHDSIKVPIMRYVNNKRIMYAQELIKEGYTLIEVSEKLGFNDYSTFYRNYTKIIGYPPSKII